LFKVFSITKLAYVLHKSVFTVANICASIVLMHLISAIDLFFVISIASIVPIKASSQGDKLSITINMKNKLAKLIYKANK
jgi:hypothetical protein